MKIVSQRRAAGHFWLAQAAIRHSSTACVAQERLRGRSGGTQAGVHRSGRPPGAEPGCHHGAASPAANAAQTGSAVRDTQVLRHDLWQGLLQVEASHLQGDRQVGSREAGARRRHSDQGLWLHQGLEDRSEAVRGLAGEEPVQGCEVPGVHRARRRLRRDLRLTERHLPHTV